MAQITASMVKELRERTGVGMMECKKALVAAEGDMDSAIEALRKAGQAKGDKKAGRTTAEGLVAIKVAEHGKRAAMVEVNCETDFVAREGLFAEFAQQLADCALANQQDNVELLMPCALQGGQSAEQLRLELVAQLGENIVVRRIQLIDSLSGVVGAYVHGGVATGRIGALAALDLENAQLAKDLAMHVAAMKPEYIDESVVPEARIAQEKEIFLAQAEQAQAGKPADILEKIVVGKVKKFLKEITLQGQPFVKDGDQTVGNC